MKLDNKDLNIIKYIGESGDFECNKLININSDYFIYFFIQFMIIGLGGFIYSNIEKIDTIFLYTFSFLLIFLNCFLIISVKNNFKNNPIYVKKPKLILTKLFKNIKQDKETIIALNTLNNELFILELIKLVDGQKETNLTLKEYRNLLKDKIKLNKKMLKKFKI